MTAPGVRTFKLQYRERRVRVVPNWDLQGAPFVGPGVDLLGTRADAAFDQAAPMERWLRAREPGLTLRSMAVDLERGRVLVSFDDPHAVAQKPVALRIASPDGTELLDAARELSVWLQTEIEPLLRARKP